MIIPTASRCAILLHLAGRASGATSSFRGRAAEEGSGGGGGHEDRHRLLQACSSESNKGKCGKLAGCEWTVDKACVPATPVTTNPPTKSPTDDPTVSPTDEPTKAPTTTPPTKAPAIDATYCGCPECTETIWDTVACLNGECYTCGDRISHMNTVEGLSLPDACAYVSGEFPNGPCGPVCDPNVCVSSSPTESPTGEPTKVLTATPTRAPQPTEPYNCGCSECTASVWDYVACNPYNANECYSCGSRIDYVKNTLGKTEEDACIQVSNEFPNNECGPSCNPQLCNPELLAEPIEANLIWSDEFDVDGSPDPTKWDYDLGDGCPNICGWGNNEEQTYTSDQNNALVTNGILRISAKRTASPSGYTSTRMVTRGKQPFRYGRVRFRASVANCQAAGTWPALWMLPETWEYGGWPSSGEIDVMETVGYEIDKFFGTVHTEAYNHGIGTERGGGISKSKSEWHVFEIDWQPGTIKFAIDSQVYYQFTPDNVADYTQWPFDKDFHLLMNIAVGGTWGGYGGFDPSAFDGDGQYMEVDWVRVYSS